MSRVAVPLANGRFTYHFGAAEKFAVFDVDGTTCAVTRHQVAAPPCHDRGVFPAWLRDLEVTTVLAGSMGPRAMQLLGRFGIEAVLGIEYGSPESLVHDYLSGLLSSTGTPCEGGDPERRPVVSSKVGRGGLGAGGMCVCVSCGNREAHRSGTPCREQRCSRCGKAMLREGSAHHKEYLEKQAKRAAAGRSIARRDDDDAQESSGGGTEGPGPEVQPATPQPSGNPYASMTRENLHRALVMFAKNWLAHDGCWFLAAEEVFGLESAIELDTRTWARFAAAEARRLIETFHIPAGGGLEALERALGLRMYALVNEQHCEWSADRRRLRFVMDRCRVQETRRRRGMPDFPCRPVGIVEFTTFAKAIDPRIETHCVQCPPEAPPGEACAWEFTIPGS